ncbi:MAG: hypothetical protein FWC66_02245 [Oscillospiraceae bacterium]|nr:hypothetical protein [Oscillospiraceae bacterium]
MKLSHTGKYMILMIGLVALVFIIGGGVFYRSIQALYFAIGVIVTSALNVGKVFLLERTVRKTMEKEDPNAGKNYVKLQYLFRYFITALVLVVVGIINVNVDPPFISVWGALAGVFTLQIAVIIVRHKKFAQEE